jgi:pyrroline-5-carboxylate reductase
MGELSQSRIEVQGLLAAQETGNSLSRQAGAETEAAECSKFRRECPDRFNGPRMASFVVQAATSFDRLSISAELRRMPVFTSFASISPSRRHLATITKTIGFIGAGRMATALGRGCVTSGLVSGGQVIASDPSEEARENFVQQVPGARETADNGQVLAQADLVVLAVKPQMMSSVLVDILPHVEPRHLVISIAAGVTLAKLSAELPAGTRLVRTMPNTPCLVGLGASCFSRGETASEGDAELVGRILRSVGLAFEVEEKMLDAVTGLSGSGPAFVYRMIEALTEGGTAMGLSSELALELAVQTARGAAQMVLTTGQSPAELRGQVASPGGTTLAGLEVLESQQGPAAFRAAVEAATKRSIELGKS